MRRDAPRFLVGGSDGIRGYEHCSTASAAVVTWSEGAVTLLRWGVNDCDGWSVVGRGEVEAWVRDEHVSLTATVATTTPTAEPTAEPTPTPAPTPRPGQFTVVSTRVTYNIIGNPEANVTIRNEGPGTIDAFDVRICGFNAYGEPVRRYRIDSHCFTGVANDVRVVPGGTYTALWTLFGQETAENAEATPIRARTTGGDTWIRSCTPQRTTAFPPSARRETITTRSSQQRRAARPWCAERDLFLDPARE